MADLLETLVPILGSALLHFLWQGVAIGLLAAVALWLLRDARPQARYAIACLALLACVLVPILGIALQLGDAPQASAMIAIGPDAGVPGMRASPMVDVAAWPSRFEGLVPMIVALWAAGAGALSLRMGMGVIWIRRLRATPQGPAQAPWQARLDALAKSFGLLRPVALRLVDTLDSPASAGWLRPVVLLPSALVTRMPVELVEALLAHELAHIRRHDYLVNLMQGVVEALLFYHPVTWWLSRRIRIEREQIADRIAAEVAVAPRRLALALSELSEWRCESCDARQHPPHLAQAAHGGHLMFRIQQLIQPGRRVTGGRIAFPLLALGAVCVAVYAQAHGNRIEEVTVRDAAAAPAGATLPVPAAPRGPALPAPAVVARMVHSGDGDSRESYALVRNGVEGFTMSGSLDDIDAIKAARARLDRDFLWFRQDDKDYVIVDPATIARAQEAWREVEALNPQMEALGKLMEGHSAKLETLSEKMEQLSGDHQATPAMEAAAERMQVLGGKQQELAEEQMHVAAEMERASTAQRDVLSARMDTLSAQMDALSRQMDEQSKLLDAESRRLDARLKPIDALARQMDEASKPMEELSVQMEALSKEQEQHAQAGERELRKLIKGALEQGLAKPAPGTGSRQ